MSSSNARMPKLDLYLSMLEKELASDEWLAHGQSIEYLDSYRRFISSLSVSDKDGRNYMHYATHERIESILTNSAFYLSDGSNWNDVVDRANFNSCSMSVKHFGMCLSASSSESIAMWMLYGGIDGNGAMVNFDSNTLRSVQNATIYECGYWEDKQFQCVKMLDASAIKFDLIDVIYVSDRANNDKRTVKRWGRGKYDIGYQAFEGVKWLAKHEAWSYEKEVRLVATVSKLDLGVDVDRITSIRVPFSYSEDLLRTRVFDSPLSKSTGQYLDSSLKGTVSWDLCATCNRV